MLFRLTVGAGAPLTITCSTRTVFVDNPSQQATVTLDAPEVTTAGGTPPVTISPTPPVPPDMFSHAGTAGSALVEDFTATDGDGNTQSCSVVLQVVLLPIPGTYHRCPLHWMESPHRTAVASSTC